MSATVEYESCTTDDATYQLQRIWPMQSSLPGLQNCPVFCIYAKSPQHKFMYFCNRLAGETIVSICTLMRTMPPKLRLRGQDVEWQSKVRYLGVQIDRSMRMAAQVEHVIYQSRASRSMLRPVLRSHLQLRAKVALYKGYIHFRLTYAAPARYALCSASQRKRIQAQQNIALRMIVAIRAPTNSSGTLHRSTRGRRTADPYLENSSKRLFPKRHHYHSNRRSRIPDEKTPGHEATISPPSRTCDQEDTRSRMTRERTPMHMSTKVHGHASPIKMYATHMCNGCTTYKIQLELCIGHSYTPTVTYEA
ncbi:hypothetical protein EVAR_90425_1 [Eumeta japonica]|uniref:RNA-directed DNA polymerase from mobile element jockey n=1 Tax=Eumeta variegata TaxID=151549 RepID=A0A4C1YCE6_EUMVA|nr:hypothetical protein EVAR_90425_1 [Eumeta japonica]